MEFEQILIEIAQGLSVCNQELVEKGKEIKSIRKMDMFNMMKITKECGEINERRDKLIEDFIKLILND